MKRGIRRTQLMAEINITPFTDVVLVLLIIFMITTPLLIQHGIKVEMPKAKTADTETEKNITVLIDSKGQVYINEKQIGIDNLKNELTSRLLNYSNSPVIVKADRDVKYDIVVKVIDAAKQSGAKKFALGVEMFDGKK